MFEQTFKNIDDILHKDAGCTSELDYTEQSSWLLFLKYLDALEADKATEAVLEGRNYQFILSETYRWAAWAAPKMSGQGTDGKIDHNAALTGDDLKAFVNAKLFPIWRASSNAPAGHRPSNTKSARCSARSATKSKVATTCAT